MASKKKAAPKRKTAINRELEELARAAAALQATQHNPIAWAPLIRYLGPIVARLAARICLAYVVRKTGRKIAPNARQEVIDFTASTILQVLKRLK